MSYTISYSDPSKANFPIIVQDDTTYNRVGTGGLTLVGRNYPGYGQAISENFIHILENSASPVPPVNPIEGQLWFDTSDPSNKKLRINDGAANITTWKPINGVFQQTTEPTNAAVGDIWVDLTNSLVKFYTADGVFEAVGKQITALGTGIEAVTVSDANQESKTVLVTKVNNEIISVLSSDSFETGELVGFTNIQVGINLPTDPILTPLSGLLDVELHGVADLANALKLASGIRLNADEVLRNNINQSISGQFVIREDSNALQIGTVPTFIIDKDNITANFTNNADVLGTFNFKIKSATGNAATALSIGGSNNEVRVLSNYIAESTITGALQVVGGVGVGGNVFIGGSLYANSLFDSVNTLGTEGQILVSQGGKIIWRSFNETPFSAGGVSVGVINVNNPTESTSTATGALIVLGGAGIGQNLNVGGEVNVVSTTSSTSITSGALQVVGGVGIGGDLYVGGDIVANKLTIQETIISTTATIVDDIFKITTGTNAISTNSGAFQVVGGMGVNKDIWVGGNIRATTITASIAGVATSATNIVGGFNGNAVGSIPMQSAEGITSFIPPGTTDQFLRSSGSTATFVSTATIYVNSAVQTERLRTPRTITFTGDVTGSFIFDGSQATGTALTIQPNSIALGTDTVGDYVSTGTTTGNGISGSITGEGTTFNINSNATSTNDVNTIVFRNNVGSFAGNVITANIFNGSAQEITNIPGVEIDLGSVRNTSLTSSSIGFVAGAFIGLSTGSVDLGNSITISNLGVRTLTGSSYLAVSTSTGTVTITNNGVQTLTGSDNIAVSTSTGTVTITNNGVRTLTGSAYLAVSTSTGTVTITNNGVQTLTGSAYMAVSASTGTVTITNNGVQTLTGSAYMAVSTSTGTVTISNNGVQTLTGSAYLAVSASTGTVTITNNGVQSISSVGAIGVSASTGTITITDLGVRSLTGSAYLAVSTSTGTVTISNNGVQTLTGSAYLAVSASTGTVTITNNGVQSISAVGAIGISASTGTITITDLGVRSLTGSAYLAVSASTGTVTITNNGVQTLTGSAYLAVSASTGTVTITNNGVQTLTAGTDTAVSASTGTITVWNNSTLQTITTRGSASSNAIQITNSTPTSSVSTGALVVSGGVGIGGSLYVGGAITVTTALTVGTTLTLDGPTQNLGSSVANSTVNVAYGQTTTGNTKTVNIGTGGLSGSTTLINIGTVLSGAVSSATVTGSLVVDGQLLMRNAIVFNSTTTGTTTTFTGTPTGATVYFTNLTPPKLGIYGANAWRDAMGNVLL
jgi:hypothetical protein